MTTKPDLREELITAAWFCAGVLAVVCIVLIGIVLHYGMLGG